MAFPDPTDFDTLEKAQAEIARLHEVLDQFFGNVAPLIEDMGKARADIAKLKEPV